MDQKHFDLKHFDLIFHHLLKKLATLSIACSFNGDSNVNISILGRWESRHGEEQVLPGLSLNQKQLFWLGAANTWCSKYRPKTLEKRIKTGAHSPGRFRVIGPFSNSPDFARDFQCREGSNMNPVQKCEVW